jgi:hypothetical protein
MIWVVLNIMISHSSSILIQYRTAQVKECGRGQQTVNPMNFFWAESLVKVRREKPTSQFLLRERCQMRADS